MAQITRRHRIHGEEVLEVMKGLVLRLREHMNTKEDLTAATLCYRCLYRLEEHKAGRPDYPKPITWGYLEDYTAILEDVEEKPVYLYEPLDPALRNGTIKPINEHQEGGHAA